MGAGRPAGIAATLERLEAATGVVLGQDQSAPIALYPDPPRDPRVALVAAITAALERPPCVVSFSGGRDSSAILALATRVARARGLPDPVAVTLRFSAVASAEESGWQEQVIGHLGLDDWELVAVGEQLCVLGDVAVGVLRAHGAIWPANTYLHVPVLDRAVGGSLLTGLDGDGLLGAWRWARAQAVLHGRVRPVPRDLPRVGLALAPARVRRWRVGQGLAVAAPWLRPAAQREFAGVLRARAASEPRRWDRRVLHYSRERAHRLAAQSLSLLAAERGVQAVHPLLDPAFLAAIARAGGPVGFGDRSAAMRCLFGDLLPEPVLVRASKAGFGDAIWRGRARSFARVWDGRAGIDRELVDPDRLRDAWMVQNPPFGAASLLQRAWIAAQEA